MKDLILVFLSFFKECSLKEKSFFYLGAFSSALAGLSEALLFKSLGDAFESSSLENISLLSVIFFISLRFLCIYASAFFISRGSAIVTQGVMQHFISTNSLDRNSENMKNKIPQVINESERIGMGYYLAWQNILSNFLQFSALVLAAAILTSREFGLVLAIILPMYVGFSHATSVMVSKLGFVRMENLRRLSSKLSTEKSMNTSEVAELVRLIIGSIFRVRVWSLIQKPSLELMGILGLSIAMVIDLSFSASRMEQLLPAYVLLATIFIRLLPYVNQVQNGFTLAASVHHEVKSYNDEE